MRRMASSWLTAGTTTNGRGIRVGGGGAPRRGRAGRCSGNAGARAPRSAKPWDPIPPKPSNTPSAYAPRHQRHGRVNAAGFGAGWYLPEVRAEPARYRKPVPIWNDQTFANLAGTVSSQVIVASVRSASPGLPVNEACTAPYTRDQWL